MLALRLTPSGSLAAAGAPGGGAGGALALTDLHGNVAGQFTAGASALSGSAAYGPWGTVTAATGAMTGNLGYQSAWADPAAGKDLMGARWYDPAAGGFTSADTLPQSPLPDPAAGNPYAYAADSPLTGTDPSGHRAVNLPSDYSADPGDAAAVINQAEQASYSYGQYQQAQQQAASDLARARSQRNQAALQAARAAQARAAAARASALAHTRARAAAARAEATAEVNAAYNAARATALQAARAALEARINHTTLNPADTAGGVMTFQLGMDAVTGNAQNVTKALAKAEAWYDSAYGAGECAGPGYEVMSCDYHQLFACSPAHVHCDMGEGFGIQLFMQHVCSAESGLSCSLMSDGQLAAVVLGAGAALDRSPGGGGLAGQKRKAAERAQPQKTSQPQETRPPANFCGPTGTITRRSK